MHDKATTTVHTILHLYLRTLQVIVFCRHVVVATIQNPTIEDYTVHIPFRLFMLIQKKKSTNLVPS